MEHLLMKSGKFSNCSLTSKQGSCLKTLIASKLRILKNCTEIFQAYWEHNKFDPSFRWK